MLKKVLFGVLLVLVLLLLVGFLLPTEYRVHRSVVIAADKARIHEYVGELKRWDDWAPWKDQDKTVVTTLGEKTTGVGAHQTWSGESGQGELTFTRCSADEGIAYDMAFIRGETRMPAQCSMEYKPAGNGTEVLWTMQGKIDMPVVGGWMVLFLGPSIGGMFDTGLSRLKSRAEAAK